LEERRIPYAPTEVPEADVAAAPAGKDELAGPRDEPLLPVAGNDPGSLHGRLSPEGPCSAEGGLYQWCWRGHRRIVSSNSNRVRRLSSAPSNTSRPANGNRSGQSISLAKCRSSRGPSRRSALGSAPRSATGSGHTHR